MHLECQDISYRYPDAPDFLFKALSFRLDEPGFHAIFGPSGVGKTTLARLITGEIGTSKGEVLAGDMPIQLYTYNMERLPGWGGVGNHLKRITPFGREDLREKLVEIFGLGAFLKARFANLSLGQQNRVNLIRYLLQDFQLLILDESLANVDEKTRQDILVQMKTMFPDRFFLYISHNLIEVARFCREILVLRDGGQSPQVVAVRGQDQGAEALYSKADLDRTLLEIMDAA